MRQMDRIIVKVNGIEVYSWTCTKAHPQLTAAPIPSISLEPGSSYISWVFVRPLTSKNDGPVSTPPIHLEVSPASHLTAVERRHLPRCCGPQDARGVQQRVGDPSDGPGSGARTRPLGQDTDSGSWRAAGPDASDTFVALHACAALCSPPPALRVRRAEGPREGQLVLLQNSQLAEHQIAL